jgi:hypothetical protein
VVALLAAVAAAAATVARADEPAATHDASDGAPGEAAPSPVEVVTRVEPDTVTIGTPFRFVVEVAVPPGLEVRLAQPTERIGDFDIVDFGDTPPAVRDGKSVVTRWYRLVGYEPGYKLLPAPPVQYRRPGETLATAPEKEAVVTVESALEAAGEVTDIRDVKPPEEPPRDWRAYYLAGGILAVLGALAALLWRASVRRAGRAATAPPPTPADELARRALDTLRMRRLAEERLFKEYYSALATIVREYLERRFGLRAPEMTTEEFLLATARGGRLSPAHRARLGEFLAEADLVKFARHRPTFDDCERAWQAARRFVDETRPAIDETAAGDGTPRARRGGGVAPRAAAPAGDDGAGRSHAAG